MKLPSFPRKALEADLDLYRGGEIGRVSFSAAGRIKWSMIYHPIPIAFHNETYAVLLGRLNCKHSSKYDPDS